MLNDGNGKLMFSNPPHVIMDTQPGTNSVEEFAGLSIEIPHCMMALATGRLLILVPSPARLIHTKMIRSSHDLDIKGR